LYRHGDIEQLNQSGISGITNCRQQCKLAQQRKRPEADVSHSIMIPPDFLELS
jgi:hypothetical protein